VLPILSPLNDGHMKTKLFLLGFSLFCFVAAKANTDEPEPSRGKGDPSTTTCPKGKKDDIVGSVVHSDNKKPLKDVNVTAYLISRKEKTVLTGENGTYAFDELKPGTYKFVFEKAGFKKVTKEKVVIRTDEAFQLNIEMIENTGGTFDLVPSPLHFTDF
jgi:hypothetical protein